ncbi:MAG: M56 family metallopeptidase [Planctomycetales bacterium]
MHPVAYTAILGVFILFPMIAWRPLIARGSSRQLVAVGLCSLTGFSLGSFFLLSSLVSPHALGAAGVPAAIEVCLDAAARIFEHPVAHWSRIVISVLIVAGMARLGYVIVRTAIETRRIRALAAKDSARVERSAALGALVVLIESKHAVAFATGVLRPRIIVSTRLMAELEPSEINAVLEHERAHVRRGHLLVFTSAHVISRAFWFIPPIDRSMRMVIAGLETSADAAAARSVGDPLVVARTLLHVSEQARSAPPAASLGGVTDHLAHRIRRLVHPSPSHRRGPAIVLALLSGLLLTQMVIWVPGSASADSQRREEIAHSVCHVPHERSRL